SRRTPPPSPPWSRSLPGPRAARVRDGGGRFRGRVAGVRQRLGGRDTRGDLPGPADADGAARGPRARPTRGDALQALRPVPPEVGVPGGLPAVRLAAADAAVALA